MHTRCWMPLATIYTHHSVLHATELVVTYKQGVSHSNSTDTTWSAKHVQDLVIQEVQRAPGLNDVGMVAWLLTLRTPEYPEGRQLVLIANDITYQAGSFGTREDVVFLLATRYARSKGIPRLYLAANSGARIGLAESIKQKFKVSWLDERDPSLGYRYLYLDDADYKHFTIYNRYASCHSKLCSLMQSVVQYKRVCHSVGALSWQLCL
jgi:acetyl-CoA carboxylase / biotin carboxylase 1